MRNFTIISLLSVFAVKTLAEECWAEKLGYECCKSTTDVIMEDGDGKWGVENNVWCGIKEEAKPKECFSNPEYPCCSECKTIYTDDAGDWGYEKDQWCGIKDSCKATITSTKPSPTPQKEPTCWAEKLGYPCCEPTNTQILSVDEYGEWGMENGKKCGILIYDPNMKCGGPPSKPKECDYNICNNVISIDESGTIWGYDPLNDVKCVMNINDMFCKSILESTCWSALLGFECCKETPDTLYKDENGIWGIENGKWCGVEKCTFCNNIENIDKYGNIWSINKESQNKCIIQNTSNSQCNDFFTKKCRSAAIGYMCCKETKNIVTRDKYGFWGIENNQWCGFTEEYPCSWYEMNGVKCCDQNIPYGRVERTAKGIFTIQNNVICGLTDMPNLFN